MPRLKQIVEQSDTRAGLVFDLVVQAAILVSLVSFSIATLPHLSPEVREGLQWVDLITFALFTLEYFLRMFVADRARDYVFSFFGLVDLIAILPFFLGNVIDLRAVRIFRFLRLFGLLKFLRYSKAIRRLHRALLISKEELVLYICVTAVLLYISAVGIYYFENAAQPEAFASVFHSLWWAVATLTTVGYGDVVPVTAGGRAFTFLVLLIGIGVISVPAGLVASALSEAREMEDKADDATKRKKSHKG